MPANVCLKVAIIHSTVLPIIISRNAGKYDFRNAGNYRFRNADNYNCPKHLPSLFPEMLAIIISRNIGNHSFLKHGQLYFSKMLAIILFRTFDGKYWHLHFGNEQMLSNIISKNAGDEILATNANNYIFQKCWRLRVAITIFWNAGDKY